MALPLTSEGEADSSRDTIVEMPGHEAESQNGGGNFAEAINKNAVEMRCRVFVSFQSYHII